MTTHTADGDPLRDAIADIRRITSEEKVPNDELVDACTRLLQADDSAREDTRSRTLDGDGEFLATLDAARHRAGSYNESERATIARAITRANRSLANR